MNNILRKTISAVLMLSLLSAASSLMPISAEDYELYDANAANRHLSIDFLGTGTSPAASSPGNANFTNANLNNEFWVGVAVDNVQDLHLFTDGIYSLEVAFEYNSDIVVPYFTSSSSADREWGDAIIAGNSGDWGAIASYPASSEAYGLTAYCGLDLYEHADREDSALVQSRKENQWKMCTASLTFNESSSAQKRFTGLSDSGKQYLIKLPFKLIDMPKGSDPNPVSLSFVLGPETFDIGAGGDGTSLYSKWIADVGKLNTDENLKTLFGNYEQDILLFGSGEVIENITPFTPGEAPDPDTEYTMYDQKTDGDDGFRAEVTEYYVTVPNDVDKLKLRIKGGSAPDSVTANGSSVSVSQDPGAAKTYVTDFFNLKELDTEDNDGFNNKVEVKVGSQTYTVYIRRLLKPKIELKPGNSPYGLIEAMRDEGWDNDKIAQAKTSFNDKSRSTSSDDNTFKAGDYLPTGATAGVAFYPVAWTEQATPHSPTADELVKIEDPTINMDRNPSAIFVYDGNSFHDPGFTVTDEYGNQVDNANVKRSLKVNVMNTHGIRNAKDNVLLDDQTLTASGNDPLDLTAINTMPGDAHHVRPGVYSMVYTYEDSETGDNIEVGERPVIVLWELGDADLSTIMNGSDSTYISSYIKGLEKPIDGIKEEKIQRLYLYRIMDVDRSGIVNGSDTTKISASISGRDPKTSFYSVLN